MRETDRKNDAKRMVPSPRAILASRAEPATRPQAALALIDGEGEALTRKAINMAPAGDTVALRLPCTHANRAK